VQRFALAHFPPYSAAEPAPVPPFRRSHAAKVRAAERTIAAAQSTYDKGARAAVVHALVHAASMPTIMDIARHWVDFVARTLPVVEAWQGHAGNLVAPILDFVPELGRDAAKPVALLADALWSRRRADALEAAAVMEAMVSP
jgi:hypothetical protein